MKVKIIRRKNQAVIVEWIDSAGAPQRGSIPFSAVYGDQVDDQVLEMAAPYGLPFAEMIELQATPEEVERQLHIRGIWTAQDLLENAQAAQGAIQAAYKLDLASLTRQVNTLIRQRSQ